MSASTAAGKGAAVEKSQGTDLHSHFETWATTKSCVLDLFSTFRSVMVTFSCSTGVQMLHIEVT